MKHDKQIYFGHEVQALIDGGGRESQWLDFKREFWCDTNKKWAAIEFCKDVAALMNADGGQLVLGIEEEKGIAQKWSDAIVPDRFEKKQEQALAWAMKGLEPPDAAHGLMWWSVEYEGHHAWVLRVRPYAFGPVAARANMPKQDPPLYMFPHRVDDQTKYWTMEEAAMRMDAKRRATEVELRRLLVNPCIEMPFRLASPLRILSVAGDLDFIDPLDGQYDGFAKSPSSGVLTLRFNRRRSLLWQAEVMDQYELGAGASRNQLAGLTARQPLYDQVRLEMRQRHGSGPPDGWVPTDVADQNLTVTVPANLIRSIWKDFDSLNRLNVLLDADIVWDRTSLRLTVR